MGDTESCRSRAVDFVPRNQRLKLDVFDEVLRRLKESNNEEASLPGFEDEIWTHFCRLPPRYAMDVNAERAEDVVMHKRLLQMAHNPATRPAIEVRLVQVPRQSDEHSGDPVDSESQLQYLDYLGKHSIHPPPAFGSLSDSELLHKYQDKDITVIARPLCFRPVHEITISTYDKPKLLSQLTSLLSEIGLNIQEAHAFSTTDGYSLDVFVVDNWAPEDTERLRSMLFKEIPKIERLEAGTITEAFLQTIEAFRLNNISEISSTQNEKCKGKHFTWSKPMSHMLLEILAEETLRGGKPSSTFKAESFVKVATEIRQKFNVQCEPKHVDNHLKTVKKEWGIITKLKNKSGFGWDDCLKMITVSKDVYDEEVKAHPNHDKFLNKKLDMYEAMAIVVGKDMTTGNYAKSYADVNLEENTEEQSISIENEGEYEETSKGKETSSSSTQKRQHRKRNRMYEDDGVEKLSKQIGDVAFAIQSLSKNQLDVNALYAEVMKVDGFDEITIGDAFDHLVQNEMLAKAFMAKNANLRKIWVQNFVNQHCYRPTC